MKLVRHKKITSSMSDHRAKLSLIGIFSLVEDSLTEFMGKYKIDGLTTKREYNAVWVFVRNRVKILGDIDWNEECEIETFISSKSLAKMNIDISVKANDKISVYSRIEVCALDCETGRIRKLETVGIGENIKTEQEKESIVFAKFSDENFREVGEVIVNSTSIDYVGHTNNKEYIRFLLGTYKLSDFEKKSVGEIEIVYQNQTFEGDRLTIKKAEKEKKDIFQILDGDKLAVRCEVVF